MIPHKGQIHKGQGYPEVSDLLWGQIHKDQEYPSWNDPPGQKHRGQDSS